MKKTVDVRVPLLLTVKLVDPLGSGMMEQQDDILNGFQKSHWEGKDIVVYYDHLAIMMLQTVTMKTGSITYVNVRINDIMYLKKLVLIIIINEIKVSIDNHIQRNKSPSGD